MEIIKENKQIGNQGIERLGYVKFTNGHGLETVIELTMNVGMNPVYYVKNTGFVTQDYAVLQQKYKALGQVEEIDFIGKFF